MSRMLEGEHVRVTHSKEETKPVTFRNCWETKRRVSVRDTWHTDLCTRTTPTDIA